MMYGIDFGAAPIPSHLTRVLRKSAHVHICPLGSVCRTTRPGCQWVTLAGVTDLISQRDLMMMIADNGKRLVRWRVRIIDGHTWYGVYTS